MKLKNKTHSQIMNSINAQGEVKYYSTFLLYSNIG